MSARVHFYQYHRVGWAYRALVVCGMKGGEVMAVHIRDNESIDSALRRFKRELHQHGVLEAARRKERYEKPSDKRRRMQAAAIRRARRAARRRGDR